MALRMGKKTPLQPLHKRGVLFLIVHGFRSFHCYDPKTTSLCSHHSMAPGKMQSWEEREGKKA